MYGICFVYSPRGARRERRGYGLDDTEDGVSRLKHLRLDPSDRSAPLGVFNYINKKREGPYGRNCLSSALQPASAVFRLALFEPEASSGTLSFFKTTLYADQALPDLHTWHH